MQIQSRMLFGTQSRTTVLVHIVLSSLKLTHETIQALNIWRQIFRYRQYTSQSTTFWGPIVGQQSFPIPSFSPFVDKDKGQNLNKKTLKKSWSWRSVYSTKQSLIYIFCNGEAKEKRYFMICQQSSFWLSFALVELRGALYTCNSDKKGAAAALFIESKGLL